jgi:alpha-D-xyloside xylohydrolase
MRNLAWLDYSSTMRNLSVSIVAICLSLAPLAFFAAAAPVVERESDGIALRLTSGELRIQVISDKVVRVAFSASPNFFGRVSIDRVALPPTTAAFKIAETPAQVTLTTAKLRVIVDRQSGAVSFADAAGHPLLSEVPGSRTLEAVNVQGEDTFHVQQKWKAQKDESLYGLGQMQMGVVDIKGFDIDMWQHNTNVVVPFLVSSNGYGILWDNTSFTRFGDLRPFEPIPAANLYDADGKQGGVTVAPLDGSEPARQTAKISINLRLDREPRPHHGQLPVSGLLEWRHQGLARRHAGDEPLAAELARRERSDSSSSGRRPQVFAAH